MEANESAICQMIIEKAALNLGKIVTLYCNVSTSSEIKNCARSVF